MKPHNGNTSAWRSFKELRAKYAASEASRQQAPGPSRGALACVAVLLLLTPFAALRSSHLCNLYDADSLLPSLISLQKLTLFYWGQNRYGNLIPFLASWIDNINLNFQVQAYLRALGGASVPLFIFCFTGLRRNFVAAYAIALALALLPYSDMGNYAVWVEAEPYGLGVLLLLGALLLQRKNTFKLNATSFLRAAITLLVVCVALYVNGALILFALPLWVGYAIFLPRAGNWWFLAFLLAGYGCSSALSSHYGQVYFGAFNYTHLEFHFANLAHFWDSFTSRASAGIFSACLVVMLAGLGIVQFAHLRTRAADAPTLDPLVLKSLLILLAAALYIGVAANMKWVSLNDFAFRYFWFPFVMVSPVCAIALTEGIVALASLLRSAPKSLPAMAAPLIALALAVAAVCFKLAPFEKPPSFVEQSRRADALALAGMARQYGASFVGGNYYLVWPTVFETIRAGQNANDPHALDIHGLAPKGEHLRDEIAAELRGADRVVVLAADTTTGGCCNQMFVNNAVDWPPHATVLTKGSLPSGKPFSVIVCERNPAPQADATPLPPQAAILFHMLNPVPQVAEWKDGKINVPAGSPGRRAIKGPVVNVPAGRYRIGARIETAATDRAAPLFQFTLIDGFGRRTYSWKNIRLGDLDQRADGLWVSTELTVPESSPTQGLEIGIWTFGAVPFSITGMELLKQ
ncbi:MAG TPA: hypothetical protein VG733_09315 [Chthoniobacteraceae bacterium]|nr:hypothetical protein [Chthoniobacteraceae bacterium]